MYPSTFCRDHVHRCILLDEVSIDPKKVQLRENCCEDYLWSDKIVTNAIIVNSFTAISIMSFGSF